MDFSLGSTGQNPFGAAVAAPVRNGPDLEEIQTDVRAAIVSTIDFVIDNDHRR
jgi:hypothetical protein